MLGVSFKSLIPANSQKLATFRESMIHLFTCTVIMSPKKTTTHAWWFGNSFSVVEATWCHFHLHIWIILDGLLFWTLYLAYRAWIFLPPPWSSFHQVHCFACLPFILKSDKGTLQVEYIYRTPCSPAQGFKLQSRDGIRQVREEGQ